MNEVTAKDVLERTYERIVTFGWWGKKGNYAGRKYSHKDGATNDECKCLALHIDQAVIDLIGEYTTSEHFDLRDDAMLTMANIVVVGKRNDKYTSFGTIAKWNDRPTRHVATVKRAVKRAIKQAA